MSDIPLNLPDKTSIWIWVLAAWLALGFPLFQTVQRQGRRILKILRTGECRSLWWNLTVSAVVYQWILLGIAALVLAGDGRDLADLGFRGFHRPAPLAAFGTALLLTMILIVARQAGWYRPPRIRIGSMTGILPEGPRESWFFLLLGLNAAICEEILYRGFLITYLAFLFGGPWPALAISSLAFGLAHNGAGQAIWEILLRSGLGLLFGVAYLSGGSLVVPILLHFLVNASSFLVAPDFQGPEAGAAENPIRGS